MSSDFELSVGDVVLVESPPVHYLAFVALTADQILAIPARPGTGSVIASPGSPEVLEALQQRDSVALERARFVLGPTVRIAGACWSADGGRLTLEVAAGDCDCADIAEKLEPVFRAEVRCLKVSESSIPW